MRSFLRKVGLTFLAVVAAGTGPVLAACCTSTQVDCGDCCCCAPLPEPTSIASQDLASCGACGICSDVNSPELKPDATVPAQVVPAVLPELTSYVLRVRSSSESTVSEKSGPLWRSFVHEPWIGRAPPCSE